MARVALSVALASGIAAGTAVAAHHARDYLGGGVGLVCLAPAPFDVGGVCALDCGGDGVRCLVHNSNHEDVFTVCWDADGDGVDETCVGPVVHVADTGGWRGLVDVTVQSGGTTGTFAALHPPV